MKTKLKQTKGITLIALIITIIILLILVLVTIRILMNQGIIGHAKNATNSYVIAEEKEKITLGYQNYKMDKIANPNAVLTVDDATVEGSEAEGGWTITFTSTGNVYELDTDGNITQDTTTADEIARIRAGHNQYKAEKATRIQNNQAEQDEITAQNTRDQEELTRRIAEVQAQITAKQEEAQTNINLEELNLLKRYCLGNNDKDLLNDVLNAETYPFKFKNNELIPNAEEELTYTGMNQAEINGSYELYIYFTYNEKTYKLTSGFEEKEVDGSTTYSYPTKSVEVTADTTDLSNELAQLSSELENIPNKLASELNAKQRELEIPNLEVDGATVRGNESDGWTIAFKETKNQYTLKDGKIKGPTDSTLFDLESYFLGVEGWGQDLSIVANIDQEGYYPTSYKDNEIIKDASTSITHLNTIYYNESVVYIYVKYKSRAYKVTTELWENEEGSWNKTYQTKAVDLIYTPDKEKVEGTKRIYNGEEWTVLYNNGETVEIVSPKAIGTYTLGKNDPNAVGNTDKEKGIDSYNKAIDNLNDYCRKTLNDNSARCVGTNHQNPDYSTTEYYSSDKTSVWRTQYNGMGLVEDNNAEQDYVRMCYWGLLVPTDNQDYWFVSRAMYKHWMPIDNISPYTSFGVRITESQWNWGLSFYELWDTGNFGMMSYPRGVRACVTVSR